MNCVVVPLNLRNPQVKKDLSDVHEAHRTVQSLVPSARSEAGLLWALDHESKSLVIQSVEPLDLSRLPEAYTRSDPVVRDMATVSAGDVIVVRAWLNPTRSLPAHGGRGKKVFVADSAARAEWIARRFDGAAEVLRVVEGQQARLGGSRGGDRLALTAVDFIVTVRVLDPALFERLRVDGVGRGKAYGCGLLRIL